MIAFENQSFYNQLDRVMQGSYGRGPDVLQNVVGIVGRAPSIIGYTVILAYYAPVLLLISLGTVLTFIAAIWRMGEYSWKLLYEQTHSRRLADYFASALGSRRPRQGASHLRLIPALLGPMVESLLADPQRSAPLGGPPVDSRAAADHRGGRL